jgi:hypothetical protein
MLDAALGHGYAQRYYGASLMSKDSTVFSHLNHS